MMNTIRWCLFVAWLAWSLTGCAATVSPAPLELACDNYVTALACNPSPAWGSNRPAFTHAQCVSAFRALSQAELECLADMAACSDAAGCVK